MEHLQTDLFRHRLNNDCLRGDVLLFTETLHRFATVAHSRNVSFNDFALSNLGGDLDADGKFERIKVWSNLLI
jgi:hypothetical protein